MTHPTSRELTWLRHNAHELAELSVARMRDTLPWFSDMPESRRRAVSELARTGIDGFIEFAQDASRGPWVAADIFGSAPRELLQLVSLQETLQLTEAVVTVVEERVAGLSDALRIATLQFSRDVAFAAAHLYARAAEARGLWDARLEALVVDSIVTGESREDLASRIAALGWAGTGETAVLVGSADRSVDVDEIRRHIRRAHCDVLIGLQGSRIVLVLGVLADDAGAPAAQGPQAAQSAPATPAPQAAPATLPATATADEVFLRLAVSLAEHFADRPLVLGTTVPQLTEAHRSARSALAGVAVCAAYPEAPRPVRADDLLPERAFAGDGLAKRVLIDDIYTPLRDASSDLLATLAAYLHRGRSLEAASRALFVHTNTVRYRIKKSSDLVGLDATDPRDAFVLQAAIAVGKIHEAHPPRGDTRPRSTRRT